jgi:hypothetical protein
LFADETDNSDELAREIVEKLSASPGPESELSSAAVKLLLHAAHGKKHRQGKLYTSSGMHGTQIKAGDSGPLCDGQNSRAVAEYTAALKELENKGLSESQSDSVSVLTQSGFLKADEIEAEHGQTLATE